MVDDSKQSGNTIKYEEFIKLPDGLVASGFISDSVDGIYLDNSNKMLFYVVIKDSNQDWGVYCIKHVTVKDMYHEDAVDFTAKTGTRVTEPRYIKRVFNCSKKVLDLYT